MTTGNRNTPAAQMSNIAEASERIDSIDAYEEYEKRKYASEQAESKKEDRAEFYGAEYDKNREGYVAADRQGVKAVAWNKRETSRRQGYADRGRYERADYIESSEKGYQTDKVNKAKNRRQMEADVKKQYDDDIEWAKENAAGDPEVKKWLAVQQAKRRASIVGDTTAAGQFGDLASRDPEIVKRGIESNNKVNGDYDAVGATLSTKETIDVKRGAVVSAPKYSVGELLDGTEAPEVGIGQGEEGTGYVTDKDGKTVAITKRKELPAKGDTMLIKPELAAEAFVQKKFSDAGVEMPDTDGVEMATQTTKGAAREKNFRGILNKQFLELTNERGYSFTSRNNAIVERSLEEAGITIDTVGAQEYSFYTKMAFEQVQQRRDIDFNASVAAASMHAKGKQIDAHSGIMNDLNKYLSMQTTSPDAFRSLLEDAQGTHESLSVLALMNGTGKKNIIDMIDKDSMRTDWNTAEDRYTYFVDRVIDAMESGATRNLKEEDMMYTLGMLSKLSALNASGNIADEPLMNSILTTMYEDFSRVSGFKYDEEAKEEKEQFAKGIYVRQFGNTKIKELFDPTTQAGVDAFDEYDALISTAPAATEVAKTLGINKNGVVVVQREDTAILKHVTGNLGGISDNETYMQMRSAGIDADIAELDNTLAAFVSSEDESTLEELSDGFNKKTVRGRIGIAIRDNTRLAEGWNTSGKGDADTRQAIMLTALDFAYEDEAVVANDVSKTFIKDNAEYFKGTSPSRMAYDLEASMVGLITRLEAGDSSSAIVYDELKRLQSVGDSYNKHAKVVSKRTGSQEKLFGGNSKTMDTVNANMSNVNAVINKYEGELKSMLSGTEIHGAHSLYTIDQIQEIQTEYPWMGYDKMKIVTTTETRGGRTGNVAYIVPSDKSPRGGDEIRALAAEGNAMKIDRRNFVRGVTSNQDALDEINFGLFSAEKPATK